MSYIKPFDITRTITGAAFWGLLRPDNKRIIIQYGLQGGGGIFKNRTEQFCSIIIQYGLQGVGYLKEGKDVSGGGVKESWG